MNTPSTTAPKTSRRLVAGLVAGGVAIAGLASALTLTLDGPTAHAASAPSASSSNTGGGSGTASGSTTGGSGTHRHHHHSNPDVTPSSTIKKLQQELGSLNYYEGPINGYLTASTVQAIENLQAAAGLPQTGMMTAATQHALDYQLAHGDSQMGGNTNTPASPASSGCSPSSVG